MEKKNILYISQEITPFLPESEMSVIGRFLPQGVQERGREIRTFMPRYGYINERRNQLHEVIRLSGMNLVINDSDHPLIIKVASIQTARMQVYFIDNEDYFHRKAVLKNTKGKDFADNDERAIFFARGVLETVIKLRWTPDIIHCHGWLPCLVPIYIKKFYHDDPLFSNSKVVYSVYNESFTMDLNKKFKDKLLIKGISTQDVTSLEVPDYNNVIKMAINHSDAIIVGSTKVNQEILKHIKTSGKLILEHQPEDNYIDAYNNFYDVVLGG